MKSYSLRLLYNPDIIYFQQFLISHFEKNILFLVEQVSGSCFVFHFILSSSTRILLEMKTFV